MVPCKYTPGSYTSKGTGSRLSPTTATLPKRQRGCELPPGPHRGAAYSLIWIRPVMIPRLATGAGSDGEALAAPSPLRGARGVPEGASQNRSGLAWATAPLSPDGRHLSLTEGAAPGGALAPVCGAVSGIPLEVCQGFCVTA